MRDCYNPVFQYDHCQCTDVAGPVTGTNVDGPLTASPVTGTAGLGGVNGQGPTSSQGETQGGPSIPRSGRGTVSVTSRLLVDCMGHYSPVVRQMRGRARPEGMVLVVGACATGER